MELHQNILRQAADALRISSSMHACSVVSSVCRNCHSTIRQPTLQNTSWCSCNGGIITPTCSARVQNTAARVGSDLHCQSGNTAGRVGLHAAHCYWIACAGMHAAQCSDEHVSDKSCSTQLLREHVHDCMAASANGWLALAAAHARNSDSS